MSKRFVSLSIAIAMLFALGINAFAADPETVQVSGEGSANFGQSGSVSPDNGNSGNINSLPNNPQSSTKTTDNSTAVVEQNQTKHNAMMNDELSDIIAPSRYSDRRVALSPDISGTKYEEAAEILGALGIMVGDAETGAFRPNDNILRSEMAKVAVYTVGLEDVANSSNSPTKFPDVARNHWANGAINVASQQGMVIGDDVGTFRPDDPVLFQEAVTIIVRALGYEPRANTIGGYPAGYMVIASENQLLKGIETVASQPAKRGDIAQLVFNALTVNLMEQTGFGSNVNYEVVDKTLLYDRLNVEKAYGQITGTSETTLSGGSTTAEDRIMINDKIFIEGNTPARQLLGYNVVYYARIDATSDEKTLIVVRPQSSKNNTLSINATDIVSVTGESAQNKTVTYWGNADTDSDTKTASIVASPVYIYNGKYSTGVTNELLKPASGNLILLDTDMNNVYDIVFVNHFTNIVVESVSSATGRITDKYNNGSLVLDPENTNVQYSIIRNGNEIETTDLKEWDVISYTISEDKSLIKAYVSTESVTGTVTQISENGFKINNSTTTYKKAANYPNEIKLQDKGKFYLDMEGNVAAIDTTATTTGTAVRGTYAYLVNAGTRGSIEDTLQFKLFTVAGETVVLDATAKIRVNNTYGQTPAQVLSQLGKDGVVTPQLITYETNAAGNVTGIDLAAAAPDGNPVNTTQFTKSFAAADQIYKSASGMLGDIRITDNTVIFDIPEGAGTDTTRYAVRNRTMFTNDTPYDIIVYDLQEDFSAKALIVTSTTGITAAESPIVLVDEIASARNEDFEAVDIVYGLENGKNVELMSTDKNVFVKESGKPIKQGDVFQYSTDAKGNVQAITVLFDSDAMNTEFTKTISPDLTVVYGRVTKKFTDSVNLSVNGTVRNYSTANATVYEYDSRRNNNNTGVVTAGDIEIFEEGNEVRLLIKIYDDKAEEMVIIR